jgi:hypothetical protein
MIPVRPEFANAIRPKGVLRKTSPGAGFPFLPKKKVPIFPTQQIERARPAQQDASGRQQRRIQVVAAGNALVHSQDTIAAPFVINCHAIHDCTMRPRLWCACARGPVLSTLKGSRGALCKLFCNLPHQLLRNNQSEVLSRGREISRWTHTVVSSCSS